MYWLYFTVILRLTVKRDTAEWYNQDISAIVNCSECKSDYPRNNEQ
ncbi:hypothetical protein E2C01_061198 [Portunus trituberculatus]|uniref:Uncharacterized protein n=1 Tax=Portunus trituberculatus TaxID=210409 RepID=A0A5B7HDR1_PORTR|nr:hypothetical protein [Portunus trituberculatus]